MVEVISHAKCPAKQIQKLAKKCLTLLKKERLRNSGWLKLDLVIVAVGAQEMKKLNSSFRGKKKVTDILSFEGDGVESLGELVICLPQLRKQAHEQGLTHEQEFAYMLLHGILHLLGYDHEKSSREAKLMFSIQDRLFSRHFGAVHRAAHGGAHGKADRKTNRKTNKKASKSSLTDHKTHLMMLK